MMWIKERMGSCQEISYHLIIKIIVMGIMIIMMMMMIIVIGIARKHLLCSLDSAMLIDLFAWVHSVGKKMGEQRVKPQFA